MLGLFFAPGRPGLSRRPPSNDYGGAIRGGKPRLVTVEPEFVSSLKAKLHVKPELFEAGRAATDAESLGFNAKELTDPKVTWAATTTTKFTDTQLSLFQATFHNREEFDEHGQSSWAKTWLASLFRPNMVVSTTADTTLKHLWL